MTNPLHIPLTSGELGELRAWANDPKLSGDWEGRLVLRLINHYNALAAEKENLRTADKDMIWSCDECLSDMVGSDIQNDQHLEWCSLHVKNEVIESDMWEETVLAQPGAAERVSEIEDELRKENDGPES